VLVNKEERRSNDPKDRSVGVAESELQLRTAVGQRRSAVSADDEMPVHPKREARPEQEFFYVGDKKLKKLQKAAWNANWWPERKKNGIMWLAVG
jgi:hypothetical protein